MRRITSRLVIIMALAAMLCLPGMALADSITLDGVVNGNDSYGGSMTVPFGATGVNGAFYYGQDATNMYMAFVMPNQVYDNTFGENRVGWKKRSFKDIVNSDKFEFIVEGRDNDDYVIMDAYLDYVHRIKDSDQYGSGLADDGVQQYDGKVEQFMGSDDDVALNLALAWVDAKSSMEYNINSGQSPFDQPFNWKDRDLSSPLTGTLGYAFDAAFEVAINREAFGGRGWGDVQIRLADMHMSPEKSGLRPPPIIPPPPSTVPEPGTMALMFSSLAGMAGYARLRLMRRKKDEDA